MEPLTETERLIDNGEDDLRGREVNAQGEVVFGMRDLVPLQDWADDGEAEELIGEYNHLSLADAPISQSGLPDVEETWNRWTSANRCQIPARARICSFLTSPPGVLRILSLRGTGKTTLLIHCAAAFLACERFSVVVFVTRDFRNPDTLERLYELFYEVYTDGCYRLAHAPHATYCADGDDRPLSSAREFTTNFALLTIHHLDGARRFFVTDDPARIPNESTLTLIDDSVLAYHNGDDIAQVAAQSSPHVIIALTQ